MPVPCSDQPTRSGFVANCIQTTASGVVLKSKPGGRTKLHRLLAIEAWRGRQSWGESATRGYTHVVEASSPSRTIYLSGQLGMTPDGKFAGASGDFSAQAVQCFENLKLALAASGASFEHVVKVTAYFVDIAHLPSLPRSARPLRQHQGAAGIDGQQISKLAREGALFEIEAIAVVPLK